MEKRQAIEKLNDIRCHVKETSAEEQALVMAIDALRQSEPCSDKSYTLWKESYEELKRRMDELTSCSDLISRQAAIDELPYLLDYDGLKGENGFVSKRLVRKMLKELPPAQPEPKEGHWISTDCGLDVECKCSRCGYKDFVEPRDEYWFNRNFCPNCGAKMKGGAG